VDFEGGKVLTKRNTVTITDDVSTELLILSPDGKLSVRRSRDDGGDPIRKEISRIWTSWISEVEKRKSGASTDDPNGFNTKP